MKRKFYFFSVLAAGAMFAVNVDSAYTNSGGAVAGRTGSPGDTNMNCGNSGCHPANAITAEEVVVDVVLPDGETVYVAGQTYTVEVTGSKGTADDIAVIGFEATVEDAAHDNLGELSLINGDVTKIVGMDYITHTAGGNTPVGGNSRTWKFEWTAPEGFEGEATVYAAVLFGNGNGMWSGDVTVTGSKSIAVQKFGLDIEEANAFQYDVYPNPTSDMVSLAYILEKDEQVNILVMDMAGREVANLYSGAQTAGQYKQSFNLDLSKGNYLLALQKGKRKYLTKLVVAD